jgi:hypothetical protein
MNRFKLVRAAMLALLSGIGALGCSVGVEAGGPTEECRSVEVRNRHDVEVCHARCNDNGCREHCNEREQWSRQHRCWVE